MPKKSSEEPKDDRKIFDSFMDFLASDLWCIPVSQFLEQRSIVFEREPTDLSGASDTAECYQAVHKEFVGMVNDLLGAYCQDGGLTRERLMGALKATDARQGLTQKQRMLLEPIVAAHDFDVFVPMMMRKNIELQLQALKMIEHMKGLVPNALKLGQEEAEIWDALIGEDDSDRLILISVLKQSKEEWERDQRMRQDWQSQMEAAIRESLREKEMLEQMRRREQHLLEQAMSKASADNSFGLTFTKLSIEPKAEKEEGENGAAGTSSGTNKAPVRVEQAEEQPKKEVHFIGPQLLVNEKQQQKESDQLQKGSSKPRTAAMVSTSESESGIKAGEVHVAIAEEPKGKPKSALSPSTSGTGKDDKSMDRRRSVFDQKEAEMKGAKEKRPSLGQVHVPARPKEETTSLKGDLAYRSLLKERDGIPEKAMQNRMRYLREQRDKLLQKKSREREKQLIAATKAIDESRPRTAQAARGLMEQRKEAQQSEQEQRRQIAAKIKAEVIDKRE